MGVITSSIVGYRPIPAGTWTRLAQGPLIQLVVPYQLVEVTDLNARLTVDAYSASPPFYHRSLFTGSVAYMTNYPVSPWFELWILTDRSCGAKFWLDL